MPQTTYTAKERVRPLRNNDPLAHVYLLQDSYDGKLAEQRIYTEFVTDMGERLKDQPFRSIYAYTYTKKEITYATGLQYIASLEQSYEAARNDVAMGIFADYHVARQEAFYIQGKQVIDWLNSNESSPHLLLFSLCPSNEELPYDEAKKQSFKPDRMMASIQLHSKQFDGTATTVAFSLDGMTLDRLRALLQELGIEQDVKKTTLEQLTCPTYIYTDAPAECIVDTLIATYDSRLENESNRTYMQGVLQEKTTVEANAFVASHPEVFDLYKKVITQVASSLKATKVQSDLANTIEQEFTQKYQNQATIPYFLHVNIGDEFTYSHASELIDYLRKRAIPEYLTQKIFMPQQYSSGSYGDIGMAGATATQTGRQYEGACPSSNTNAQQFVTATDQALQMGLNVAVSYEVPKPIFVKGNYAVIPIGACPASCKTECGLGIQDRRSGEWYCANSNRCSAYNADVFDLVFNNTESKKNDATTRKVSARNSANKVQKDPDDGITFELRKTQNDIWVLRAQIYDETLLDAERRELIKNIIIAEQKKQHLLRIVIGRSAYQKQLV